MKSTKRFTPDVVSLLKGQHRQIKRAFAGALVPGPGRQRRFDHLRSLLAVHEAAEEAHVHPVARKLTGDGVRMIRSRTAEERSAKQLLRDLERGGVQARGFSVKLMKLAVSVVQHARREEREEFATLSRRVSTPRRRMLGAESLVTQLLAPTRPHPRVNGQLTNKLATPVMGPVDRTRDLVGTLLRRGR